MQLRIGDKIQAGSSLYTVVKLKEETNLLHLLPEGYWPTDPISTSYKGIVDGIKSKDYQYFPIKRMPTNYIEKTSGGNV